MFDLSSVMPAIALAVTGFIGYLVRDVPSKIWFILYPYFSRSVEVYSSQGMVYNTLTDWIVQSFPNLQRHAQVSSWNDCLRKDISNGTYYQIKDGTICIISKTKIENYERVTFRINIEMAGPGSRKLCEKCSKYIKERMPSSDEYITVETSCATRYVTKRGFETVYTDCVKDVKRDLDIFLQSRELYRKRGIPYKTGFLFYGDPGTGKSTMAKAIATYLGWNITYVDSGENLSEIYAPKNTVILLEDFDCMLSSRDLDSRSSAHRSGKYFAATRPAESEKNAKDGLGDMIDKAKLHKYLNFLDGTASPEDVIFVATTNYIDRIDPAITRPGRFDHVYEVGRASRETAKRACKNWEVPESALDSLQFPATMAEVQCAMLAAANRNKGNIVLLPEKKVV